MECDFIVDYENGVHSLLEPIFSEDSSSQWEVEMSIDFLDASRSHKFFRAFYVPFTRSEHQDLCYFGKYVLLRNKISKAKRKFSNSGASNTSRHKSKASAMPSESYQEEL